MTRPRELRAIARGFETLIKSAHERPDRFSARVPFERAAVRESRFALDGLISALRTTDNPHPCGVAMAEQLLTSYDSPVYEPVGPQPIRDAADAAVTALGQRH